MCYATKQYWYVCRGLDIQPLGDKYVRRVISEKNIKPKYYPSADRAMIGKRIYHILFGEGIIDSVSGGRVLARFFKDGKSGIKQIGLSDRVEESLKLCH